MNRLYLLAFLLLAACSSNNEHITNNTAGNSTGSTVNNNIADSTYMRTGFYFLADSGKGVSMHKDKSGETYTIDPIPFASVDNISKAELDKNHLNKGDYTELCLTFDKKGTVDLAEGTGNPLHPKIAAIVANRLLFVVDNRTSIKTGVMCVGLVGYSEQDMQEMRIAVDHKK